MSTLRLGRLGTIELSRPHPTTPADTDPDVAPPPTVDEKPDTAEEPDGDDGGIGAESDGPDDGVHRRRRWRSPRVRIAAAAVLVVLAVTTTITGVIVRNDNRDQRALQNSAAAQQAVATTVVSMLSYDYADAENQLPTAEKGLTDNFRPDYTNLINNTIIPGAKQKQVVTRVSVVGNSVVSRQRDRVTMLLFLNQVTTTATEPKPATTGSRVEVTALQVDGRWLVDKLTPL
ncbi:twin-arginine translocation pathway signal [Williamsia maris]|uniref:Mce-associated membrane protein n=1 Tax=Williamsia maris TaxID=72806 RepID=A0ABT1HBG7_9NOCA|nr:twin-arginine translocation pathway signal [Williamsia maris]MCP2175509.1 Mce-associated membrane protein [Williamsia maris]